MKGFFRKKHDQDKTIEVPTRPISQEHPTVSASSEGTRQEPPQLVVGCSQSVGKQRDHNEDALFTLTTNLTGGNSGAPFGIYIVADGMGGHQHGEVASSLAVHIMASHLVNQLYLPLLNQKSDLSQASLLEVMQNGMHEAHRAITKEVPGGGTTLTAALVVGNQVTLAHVGDSRAYLVEGNERFEALTRDHSLVKRLLELGTITPEEAAVYPQKNVLLRAMGMGEPFEPDISSARLPASSYLLLCSDGLWNVVSEVEIHRIILSTGSPQEACQKLVEAANAAGGPDNITAIVVRFPR